MKVEEVALELERLAGDPTMASMAKRRLAKAAAIRELIAERDRMKEAIDRTSYDVEQTLGRALGYPRYADDQKNFPGATDADGVCVGDHVPGSLAAEAAKAIAALRAERDELQHTLSTTLEAQHRAIAAWQETRGDPGVVGK